MGEPFGLKKAALFLAVGLFLLFLGLRLYQELSSQPVAAIGDDFASEQPALLVETAQVRPYLFETQLEVLGELVAQAVVDVMSRVSGRLQQILVQRGDPVEKGTLLAIVEDADLRQQVRRAEAAIGVARARVARERATCQNLEIQVKRYRGLHEATLVSTQDLQDLESRLRVAEAQQQLAKAQVEQAEASLRELKIQLEQTRIYSPLSGFVGTRYLDPGALASPSVPIVSVLNVDRLKTIVPVSEAVIDQVRTGLPAEVILDAFPERVSRGTITRISPFLSPETRSAEVEIEIPNPKHLLKPGMFARVKIDVDISRRVFSIPRSALLTRGNEKGVYLLTKQLTTVFQPIEIGRIQGDVVEVRAGLEEGAEIVTTGAQNLNEGDRVRKQ